jgi:hypothetical protein
MHTHPLAHTVHTRTHSSHRITVIFEIQTSGIYCNIGLDLNIELSLVHPLAYSLTHLLIGSLVHSPIHSPVRPLVSYMSQLLYFLPLPDTHLKT